MIDSQLVALSRAWCLYEMWTCIHDADLTKLKVCFPGEWKSRVRGGEVWEVWTKCGNVWELVRDADLTKLKVCFPYPDGRRSWGRVKCGIVWILK